ncbi:MAG: L-threonine dehydratase [marine bacterium B5-7]|nr:MAG: L-threonine dehydratase [marine bacterium B5-7]
MPQQYLKKILTSRVYDVARETPLDQAFGLSRRLGYKVWLKREDSQDVFSFKIRGAYNKMAQLPEEVLKRGVVAASAGNHAQGVAMAAQHLKCQATIFMPVTTPTIKVAAVRNRGAKIKLTGDTYDETSVAAATFCEENDQTYIPPFDDPDIIAGQGTIGIELLNQHAGEIEAIFVPVGGGGLISGIATYIKQLRPKIKIIGVEPEDAASMTASLKKGRRVTLPHVGQFADGVAVRTVGKETFRICRRCVDDMVVVSTDEMCAAIKDIFEDTRSITEAAGALAVAGLKKYVQSGHSINGDLIAISTGANMNFDRLRHVSERAEIGERREAILCVTIPEKPGSFRAFCRMIGRRSVTEFNYRYADTEKAQIYVGLSVSDDADIDGLVQKLDERGYATVDLTDNELAKEHIRHMVGGRAPRIDDEMLFRFLFPERPGALSKFLDTLGDRFNISLFHYRNHGADYGRVLCGIQVPDESRKLLKTFLDKLGYEYSDESDNVAYRLFLG